MAAKVARSITSLTKLLLGGLLWSLLMWTTAESATVHLEPGYEQISLTAQMEYLATPSDSPLPPPGLSSAPFVTRDALQTSMPRSGWYWQRVTLVSDFERPSLTFLAMDPYWVDDIRVYRLEAGRLVELAHHGDRIPWSERELPGRKFFQPLPLQPGEEITIYLGFQVLGPLIANVSLYESTSLWDYGIRQDLIIGATIAVLAVSGLMFLFIGATLRIHEVLAYGAAVLLSALQVTARFGVLEAVLPGVSPTAQHVVNWIGGLGGAILILEASMRVFEVPTRRPRLYLAMWGLIVLALASGALTHSWFAPYWTTIPYQVLALAAVLTMGMIMERLLNGPLRALLLVCAAAFVIRLIGFLVEVYTAASVVDFGEEGFSGVLANSIIMVILLNIAMGMVVRTAVRDRDLARDEARRAVRRWQDQSELIGMLSHEFRNPLAAISRSAQMLISHPDFDPERRLQGIRKSADHLYSLVERLLSVESFEFRKDMLQMQAIDLEQLTRSCIAESREPARLQLGRVTPGLSIRADSQLLSLAISNLLDNALKFSPSSSIVEVEVAAVDGQGQVTIQDHGSGIDPGDLEQVGTPFYRADAGRKVAGVGLGFLLARRIVESHGGSLSIASAPGRGTRVTVTLPN
ncbi:MAG: sensor histidine kinase [Steroidobacteraceae bacterium]